MTVKMTNNSSSDDTANVFSKPAVKLLCRQLKDCHLSNDSQGMECWMISLRSGNTGNEALVPLHLVWLQGVILNVINPTSVVLKDSSGGLVKITDCDRMPGCQNWIKKGVYCSVIGHLVHLSQTPQLQACKMTPLDDNPLLQTLWDWEVKDLANVMVDGFS